MEIDDEMLQQFLDYLDQAITEMADHISVLESQSGDIAVARSGFYGAAHNIKGMGITFGYDLLTEIGTICCAYMKDPRQAETLDSALMRDFYKVFHLVISNRIDGDAGEKGQAIVSRMQQKVAESTSP